MIKGTVFVDIDGVLADFIRPAFASLGVCLREERCYPSSAGWDCVKAFNMLASTPISINDFWNSFNRHEFWAALPIYDYACPLLEYLGEAVGKSNVLLASSATLSPASASGKVEWIQKQLPAWIRRQYFIGSKKHLLAGSHRILIDDSYDNCLAFRQHGGKTIMVPRPWNPLGCLDMDMLEYLKKMFWSLY